MKKILYLLIFFGLLSIVWAEASWKNGVCIYDSVKSSYVESDDIIWGTRIYTLQERLIDPSSSERLVCNKLEDAHYKIKYHYNDGTNNTQLSEDLKYGVPYDNLPNITRTGHTFTGWKDSNGQIYKTSITGMCEAQNCVIDLYAQWTVNSYTYNINYVSSSGKSLGSTTVSNFYGKTRTISAPDKTGYNTPSSQSVTWDSTSPKTITFTYEPTTYTISYNLNGGSISGQPTSYTVESSTINLPNPSRTYYSFTGWTGGNSIPAGSTGNKTFTANWSISQYRYVVVLNVNSLAGKDFTQSNYTRQVTVVINHNNTSSVSNGGAWSSSGSKCWWGEDKTQNTMNGITVASVSRQYPNGVATSETLPNKTFTISFASSFGCGYASINPTITLYGNGTSSISGGSGSGSCYGYVDGCLKNNQSAVTVTSVR